MTDRCSFNAHTEKHILGGSRSKCPTSNSAMLGCLYIIMGSRRSHLPRFPSSMLTWQNGQHSTTPLLVFRETHVGNDCRNSILMTCHYPNLGSSSDWLKQNRPIRSTTQIWRVTPHQCGISAVVSLTSFREETNGGVSKCRLFPETSSKPELRFVPLYGVSKKEIELR